MVLSMLVSLYSMNQHTANNENGFKWIKIDDAAVNYRNANII